MGIAGFFLWLKQYYSQCIENIPQPVVNAALNHKASPDSVGMRYRYDNLYIDMNGLLHPCCHDTFPLPEPKSEEEMFQRLFDQLDLLVKVVRPRKCLVLCVDGVAPRSKMNQQRSRRFRSVDERAEGDAIIQECADAVEAELGLPRPEARAKWDHNVITPATEFMDRMGLAVEWFIMKKINEDPTWRRLVVVYSDAHVPGEGEHKIVQYIRGLRSQPGYRPSTSHVIHGMDADLICLGLSLHEEHVSILRNQLTETFQPDHSRFCYFNLHTYRAALKEDFGNITDMDFERVLDDFVYLCFFVGNDFLPHIPLVSIKTQGIEMLLDHYVRNFSNHGYLTNTGEVHFPQLTIFLESFVKQCMPKLRMAYHGVERARRRASTNVNQRIHKLSRTLGRLKLVAFAKTGHALAQAQDRHTERKNRNKNSNNENGEDEEEEDVNSEDEGMNAEEQNELDKAIAEAKELDEEALAAKILSIMADIKKERVRFVADQQPLPFSYLAEDYRAAYYKQKLGWDLEADGEAAFEKKVQTCCAEYLRGTQWVMRYYTRGCPSWGWYYPYHYAPLLQDLAQFHGTVSVVMHMGAPLHPVEQLLSVLPRQSVHGLPQPLHAAVLDPKSALGPFYPENVDVDFSEANFSYQGVLRLPFIDCTALQKAAATVAELEPDVPVTLVFCHEHSELGEAVAALLQQSTSATARTGVGRGKKTRRVESEETVSGSAAVAGVGRLQPITEDAASHVPIAGCIGLYEAEWPLHARIACLDEGLKKGTEYGADITDNAVRCFQYEMNNKAPYIPALLSAGGKVRPKPTATTKEDKKENTHTATTTTTTTTTATKKLKKLKPSPEDRKRSRSTSSAEKLTPEQQKRADDGEDEGVATAPPRKKRAKKSTPGTSNVEGTAAAATPATTEQTQKANKGNKKSSDHHQAARRAPAVESAKDKAANKLQSSPSKKAKSVAPQQQTSALVPAAVVQDAAKAHTQKKKRNRSNKKNGAKTQ